MENPRRASAAAAVAITALLLLALLSLVPLERHIRLRLSEAATELQGRLETEIGLRVSFQALSPSILRALSLGQVEIARPDGHVLLRARRVYAYYNVGALLHGHGESFLSEINLEQVEARLRSEDIQVLEELLHRRDRGRTELPPIVISGRGLSIEMPDVLPGGIALNLRNFRLDGRKLESGVEGEGNIRVSVDKLGTVDFPFFIEGALSRGLDRARLHVGFSARAASLLLSRQDFELSYAEGIAELRKVRDAAPIDLLARYSIADKFFSASLKLENFSPSQRFQPREKLLPLAPWLNSSYSGTASIEFSPSDTSKLHYALDLSGTLPKELVPSGTYIAQLVGEGGLREVSFTTARVEGPLGQLSFSGLFRFSDLAPEGTLTVKLHIPGPSLEMEGAFELYGSSGNYAALAPSFRLGEVEFHSLSLEANMKREELDFALSLLMPEELRSASAVEFSGEAMAVSGLPRLRAEGSLGLGRQKSLEFSLGLESISCAPLRSLFDLVLKPRESSLVASCAADGEIFVRSDLSKFSFSTTDLAVTSRLLPGAYILISASGNEHGLRLRRAMFSYAGIQAELSGEADFSRAERLGFSGNLLFSEVPYAFQGSFVGSSLTIQGDYGLDLRARLSDNQYFLSIVTTSLPLPLPDLPLIISMDADARFVSLTDWNLALSSLSLGVAPGGTRPFDISSLEFAGIFDPVGGTLSSIAFQDATSKLTGSGRISYRFGGEPEFGGSISLSAPSGEAYRLDGRYAGETLQASLAVKGSPISRFVQRPISGLLDGEGTFSGKLEDLAVDFHAALREAKLSDLPLALSLSGHWAKHGLAIDTATANWHGLEFSGVSGDFFPNTGAGNISGHFRASDGSAAISFNFDASGSSRRQAASLAELFTDYHIDGGLTNFNYRNVFSQSWPFSLDRSREGLSFRAGTSQEIAFDLKTDGNFAALAAAPFPFRFDAQGRVVGGTLEAEAHAIHFELPLLLSFLGNLPLTFPTGTLEGNLVIRGPISDPEFSGALSLEDFSFTVPDWIGAPVGPFNVPLLIDGKRMSASAPSAPVGASRVALRADAILDGWLPGEFKASVRGFKDSPIPLNAHILGITVKGSAQPSLDFDISRQEAAISGSILVESADVVLSPEMLERQESAPTPAVFLNIGLGINFGRGVRVYFPSKDIPIVAGDADPSSHLEVVYDQAESDLSLKGEAVLRGGDVFYIQRNFFLKNARIVFNENFDNFNPRLTLLAELRDSISSTSLSDRENITSGSIVVTLRVDNEPIAGFNPKLSSNPPMSEAEIVLLLGEGLLSVDSGQGLDFRHVAIAGSEFLSQFNVSKAFERRVRDALGLDVFFIRTQALQRWLIDVSGVGQSQTTSLADYLDETTLYVGKYLGDSVFTHGEVRLRAPLVPSGPFRLDSEFGVEFQTPFGLLEWNVSPEYPENLFISDQSLSLSWRLVY